MPTYGLYLSTLVHEFSGIYVRKLSNSIYLYSYSSSGENHIETMKELAISGYGLNSYINKYVKLSYESKLR